MTTQPTHTPTPTYFLEGKFNCDPCHIKGMTYEQASGHSSCLPSDPIAHVSQGIAQAFGMEDLPNVVISKPGPGVTALTFGFDRSKKS